LKPDCNDYGVALEEWKGIDERHVWSVDFDTSGWRGVLVLVLSLHVYFTLLISPSMRFDLDDFHPFSSNSFILFLHDVHYLIDSLTNFSPAAPPLT